MNYNRIRDKEDDDTPLSGIFTEAQRQDIRQKLVQFQDKHKKYIPTEEKKTEEKKERLIPFLNDQTYRKEFTYKSYPTELDEIPHIMLLRTHIWPYIINQQSITIAELQFLAEKSGIEGTCINTSTNQLLILNGDFPKGGHINKISFYLKQDMHNSETVIIKELLFHSN